MQLGGVGWSVFPGFKISFGSGVKRAASEHSSEAELRKQINFIYREVVRLRKAFEAIHNPLRLHNTGAYQQAQPAGALSSSGLNLIDSATFSVLQSSEEINTTPTSYSTFEPDWVLSSAQATLGGTYDGSNGAGALTFKVDRDGTHGLNDLKIKVYAPDDSFLEDINIKKNDALDKVYSLSNGLTFTLGRGDLIEKNYFTVNIDDAVPTSFDPVNPQWTAASTAQAGITGIYDGSQGTGTLTFQVDNEGTHGVDDLKVKLYAPDDSFIEDINIDKNDPVDQQYTLSNGLIFTLSAGDIFNVDSLTLDVYEAAPTDLNNYQPDWVGLGTSDAQATIDGTYDGSNGPGTLTFKVDKEGTHGIDDLKIKVYAPDDSFIEDINIDKNDPVDQQYTLSNGLTLTLGNGDLVKTDTFTLDVSDSPPSSFTGFEPAWNGLFSDAQVTLDGTYDGSNGTGTFTFLVDKGGTHGATDLKIKMYDPDGNFLEEVNIKNNDPINKLYTLSNGITLSLGDGDLLKGDTFTLTFNETIGSVVDPTKPFNGTGDNSPNLESGFSVTDGAFDINGVTIDVYASDSINDVLDRINQSAAGVTATFDALNEKIVITQNTAGSAATITLGSDTSGFVAAMKLDSAVVDPGTDADPDRPLAELAQFSSVTSGTIYINGEGISIDVNTHSLNDVIDMINASGADVNAQLSQSPDIISILSRDSSRDLVLDSGGTGFFEALYINPGTYEATPRTDLQGVTSRKSMTKVRAEIIADKMRDAAEAFSSLFNDKKIKPEPDSSLSEFISNVRADLQSAVSAAFDSESSDLNTKFGINFGFNRTLQNVFDISRLNHNQLVRKLTTDGTPVNDLFFGRKSKDDDGLVEKILNALETTEKNLKDLVGTSGIFVDMKV